jgi:hypothetical protein
MNKETLKDKFMRWIKIDSQSGCWFAKGTSSTLRYNGEYLSFANVSYLLTNPHVPFGFKSQVVRRCGNTRCFNPDHLIFDEIERFWFFINKTTENECWNWQHSMDGGGYGTFVTHKYGMEKSHRIAYLEKVGKIPDGMFVLHHCDNPACCNPKHLFLGTHQDNMDDKVSKNRQHHPLGIMNGRAQITEKIVKQIRKDHFIRGLSYRQLVTKYMISQTQIGRIVKKESWAWV